MDSFLTRGNTRKKEYGWYPEKKWLILAFLNKKALCKSVASWSSGKAGKAGAILLVFARKSRLPFPGGISFGKQTFGQNHFAFGNPGSYLSTEIFPILVGQPVILTQAIGLPGRDAPSNG
ncbi:MAG: hypothetical protein ACLT8E_05725 [Akkermansia sp.]